MKKYFRIILASLMFFFFASQKTAVCQTNRDINIPPKDIHKALERNAKFMNPGLNAAFVNSFNIRINKPEQKHYRIDTALVLSVSSVPVRYIYTYSSSGYQEAFLVQNFKNGVWVNTIIENATYDAYGNKLNSLWRVWDNGNWMNYKDSIFTYENSLLVETIGKKWIGGVWENESRETYDHDSFGNVVAYLSENWLHVSWVNVAHELYTYTPGGELLSAFFEKWENGGWLNEARYTFTYNNKDYLTTLLTETWTNGSWQNSYRDMFTYDANNNLKVQTGEIWTSGSWKYSERYNYSYYPDGLLMNGIREHFSSGTWINDQKASYTYDTYGGVQSFLLETWSGGIWMNFSLTAYDYDTYGNAVLGRYFVWDAETWKQTEDGIMNVYYDFGLNVASYLGFQVETRYESMDIGYEENDKANPGVLKIWPNPVDEQLFVKIIKSNNYEFSLHLSDARGNIVWQTQRDNQNPTEAKVVLNTAGFAPGVYLLTIVGENLRETTKVIVFH